MLQFKKTINLYSYYIISKKALPIWFVFLLYLKGKGLSYTEALLLDSVAAGVSFLFEVPSGIIADRYSRKRLMWLGELLLTSNYVLLFFNDSYFIFIVGAILSGIGSACVSGTGEALVYDLFCREGKEKEYLSYVANNEKWGLRCAALATLVASFLYDLWLELPIVISVFLQFASLIMIALMNENFVLREKIDGKFNIKEHYIIIKSALKNKDIFKIIILYVVMLEIVSNLYYSAQTFLPDLGLEIKYLGIISFVFNIVASLGAKNANRIKINAKILLLFYGILLILMSFSNLYVAILLLVCSRFISGFIWPILSFEFNSKIDSANRATMLSVQGLISQIAPMFCDPLIGILFDKLGIGCSYAMMGLGLLFVVSIYVLSSKLK